MAKSSKNNDPMIEICLLIVPLSLCGCAYMWWRYNAMWGILTGLLTFGLCYYHLICKKKS